MPSVAVNHRYHGVKRSTDASILVYFSEKIHVGMTSESNRAGGMKQL